VARADTARQSSDPATTDVIVLAGAAVVAGDDLTVLEPGYVVIRNGLIVEVGEGHGPEGLWRLDLTGRLILPGFINGHTHVEDAALKELAFAVPAGVNLLFEPDGLRHVRMADLPRGQLIGGIRAAAEQMIAGGTIAFADYRTGGARGAALLREAVEGLPIRCLVFGGHSRFPVQDDAALRANYGGLTPAQLQDVADTVEVADGFAPVRVNDTTDEALRQITGIVRRAGKRLSTHSAASPDYRSVSLERTGRTDIDRAVEILSPDFVVHMTVATDGEIQQMVDAAIPIVMCARTMASLGRPIPPYVSALGRGATVGLGTDNVMMSSPDLLAEVDFLGRASRSVARDPTAVDARQLLASITIDAARTLGLDEELGSLRAGKEASMVVLDRSRPNLRDSVNLVATAVERATAADIEAVMVQGVVAHGSLPERAAD
jgi:cytosine/adenosine deaminase-related metal-dependent hydrolase